MGSHPTPPALPPLLALEEGDFVIPEGYIASFLRLKDFLGTSPDSGYNRRNKEPQVEIQANNRGLSKSPRKK